MPEEASASESASEIITGLLLNHYPGDIILVDADFGPWPYSGMYLLDKR
jgi:hypothetical protein